MRRSSQTIALIAAALLVAAVASGVAAEETESSGESAARPTPNELAIFSYAVRRNVLPWLEQQPVYAGAWLDRETAQLVVRLTEPAPAVIAGIDARVPGGRQGWRLMPGDHSEAELEAAVEAAFSVDSKVTGARKLEMSSLDVQNNRVELRFERGTIKDVAAAEREWQRALRVPVYIYTGEPIAPSTVLAGEWTKLPKAPWATGFPAAVAVDGRMLVLDLETGRLLRFDPGSGTWKLRTKLPKRVQTHSPWVWTGQELVVLDRYKPNRIYAYDSAADAWRRLPASPLPGHDRAVWADGRIIVAHIEQDGEIDIERDLAMLDMDTGTWGKLPPPTGRSQLVDLHWTGSELLAVTADEYDDHVQVEAFDLATGAWSRPVSGPVSWWHAGAAWTGDRLVFSGGDPFGREADASFDPATMDWTTESFECPLSTGAAVWTGELLVSTESRYSLDPATGTCYRFPGRDRTLSSNTVVWTGDRVIYWSGGGTEEGHPNPYRRGGHAFIFDPDWVEASG